MYSKCRKTLDILIAQILFNFKLNYVNLDVRKKLLKNHLYYKHLNLSSFFMKGITMCRLIIMILRVIDLSITWGVTL